MATIKFEVAAFDGRNNFGLWRIKMLALLRREGSECALDNSFAEGTKNSDKVEVEKKAHSAILLSLSDKVLCQVGNEKTAAELWKKLEALYMKKSVTTRLYLKQRLFTFKMKEGTALQDHLADFNQIVMDMENAEIKTVDEDLACVLLFSLPPAYNNFVNSMMHGKPTLTLEDVRSSLNSAEMRNLISGSDRQDNGDGLATRGRLSTRSRGSRSKSRGIDKSNIECYYCHEMGHFKSECKVLESKRNREKETPSASNVEEGNESNASDEFVLTTCTRDGPSKQWVMDSGCSFHMCFNRNWFTTYEKRAGTVLMGNNAACKVAGIGSIRIRCHDGMVRTLTNVRHVPDLKKNLISLGTLDALGYRYSCDNGTVKVCKGSLVILKAKLVNSLYILLANTVLRTTSVLSSKLSGMKSGRSWQVRPGHMSKRRSIMSSKQGLLKGEKISTPEFCESFVFGKQRRVSFVKALISPQTEKEVEICGP